MKFEFNRKEWETTFLKPGGYIAKIKNVVVVGEKISIVFDIVEGEFKDNFMKEYQKNGGSSKFDINKWNKKAIVNFDFQYTGAKYAFAQFLNDLESSNQSFRWNNETNDLKNKLIGVVYKKNTYEDKFGDERVGTDFPIFTSTKNISTNNFSIEEKVIESKTETSTSAQSFDIMEDDIEF